jgi:hypothetical protein
MAQEGIQKLLNPELEEPSEQRFQFVDELLELEAQNSIYTTWTLPRKGCFFRSSPSNNPLGG